MTKWLLPTLSEILLQQQESEFKVFESALNYTHGQKYLKAQREWSGAIAALRDLLGQQALKQHSIDQNSDRNCWQSTVDYGQGLVLCGPLPLFSHSDFLGQLSTWIFIPDLLTSAGSNPLHLLPAQWDTLHNLPEPDPLIPVLNNDPLTTEQFCLVMTQTFSLVLVLSETVQHDPIERENAQPNATGFQFSFAPEIITQCWQVLEARARLTNIRQVDRMHERVQHFHPKVPDYRLVSDFSHRLLDYMPHFVEPEESKTQALKAKLSEKRRSHLHISTIETTVTQPLNEHVPQPQTSQNPILENPIHTSAESTEQADLQLLQAIAHEVRTPLATIRTLTRLLLKRKDLAPEVLKRLDVIDHECTEQIDRFGLIFKAVEMETTLQPRPCHLAATSLVQVFKTSVPRWQKQADRRSLTLNVALPQSMPTIVSDPTMLDQALTGVIERFTRHLPAGSQIEIEVSLAGDQLKLQLQSHIKDYQQQSVDNRKSGIHPESFCYENQDNLSQDRLNQRNAESGTKKWHKTRAINPKKSTVTSPKSSSSPFSSRFQSLGNLLLFQPETGSLSLNLDVTKNLFQAMGGKLKIRERSQQGEILTIFLPLEPPRR